MLHLPQMIPLVASALQSFSCCISPWFHRRNFGRCGRCYSQSSAHSLCLFLLMSLVPLLVHHCQVSSLCKFLPLESRRLCSERELHRSGITSNFNLNREVIKAINRMTGVNGGSWRSYKIVSQR